MPQSWEELKAEGNDLLNKGDSQAACEKYTEALALVPQDSNTDLQILFSNRSAAQLKSHNFAEALKDAERCVELNPAWAKAYNRKANALKELGNLDEALLACDKGLEIEPNNPPLLALRKSILTAQVVEKLHGTWHGMVAEEVGGYMQVFDFINESEVIVRVLGTTVNARYGLDVTADPHPHLDINVPNSPGAAFVRHIYRFTDDGHLELCSPYLRPPEERPTEFEGLGMVVMKRGNYVRTEEEEAFRAQMQEKTLDERTEEFLRQCIAAVPEIDVRPFESDSDADIAKKLTANVKFQTFYQTCTDRIGQDTETVVKELMIGDAEPKTLEIGLLVTEFRNAMLRAGLIAGGEQPQQQQQQQSQVQQVEEEVSPADFVAAAAAAAKEEPVKKKKQVKAEVSAAVPATEETTNWIPVIAAIAAVGLVVGVAVSLLSKNNRD